jgi:hypothetical protein
MAKLFTQRLLHPTQQTSQGKSRLSFGFTLNGDGKRAVSKRRPAEKNTAATLRHGGLDPAIHVLF